MGVSLLPRLSPADGGRDRRTAPLGRGGGGPCASSLREGGRVCATSLAARGNTPGASSGILRLEKQYRGAWVSCMRVFSRECNTRDMRKDSLIAMK